MHIFNFYISLQRTGHLRTLCPWRAQRCCRWRAWPAPDFASTSPDPSTRGRPDSSSSAAAVDRPGIDTASIRSGLVWRLEVAKIISNYEIADFIPIHGRGLTGWIAHSVRQRILAPFWIERIIRVIGEHLWILVSFRLFFWFIKIINFC